MSKRFISKKTIVTGFLTALMTLGSASPFWDLPSEELDSLLGTSFSVTIYAADLSQFKDTIPQWASNDISYLVDKGIIKGYDDGTFRADGQMTRLEFLKAVVCSLKTEAEIDSLLAEARQTDLFDTGSTYGYYASYIDKTLKDGGINQTADNFWGTRYMIASDLMQLTDGLGYHTTGMVGNQIGWSMPVTREEAAGLMYNACIKIRGENLPEAKGIHNIISDYKAIASDKAIMIGKLISNGLIAGVDNNYTFAPKQTLKRSEACAIIARITDQNRRLSAPTVPEDKQEYIKHDAERDITYHNPVTGQDETRDINEWVRIVENDFPSYNGTKEGEYSKGGYYQWDSAMNMWGKLIAY